MKGAIIFFWFLIMSLSFAAVLGPVTVQEAEFCADIGTAQKTARGTVDYNYVIEGYCK